MEKPTWSVPAAEDEQAAEGRIWLVHILEAPHQNPMEFNYCDQRFEKDFYIANVRWLGCVRRGVVQSYKKEKIVGYLSMNTIIRTDGPVMLPKPPRGHGKASWT